MDSLLATYCSDARKRPDKLLNQVRHRLQRKVQLILEFLDLLRTHQNLLLNLQNLTLISRNSDGESLALVASLKHSPAICPTSIVTLSKQLVRALLKRLAILHWSFLVVLHMEVMKN